MAFPLCVGFFVFSLLFAQRSESSTSVFTYCGNNATQFATDRAIPPLNASIAASLGLTLRQVHVLHRHGARVPASKSESSCWHRDHIKPLKWNCDFSENFQSGIFEIPPHAAPPPSVDSTQMSISVDNFSAKGVSFSKRYDAYTDNNILRGTCLLGQLRHEALPQFKMIGVSLYNAYFKADTVGGELFSLKNLTENPNLLYFRSTDMERTRNSGALLLNNLLSKLQAMDPSGSIPSDALVVHLGDLQKEIMTINPLVCPEFDSIMTKYFQSSAGQALLKSHKPIFDALNKYTAVPITNLYESNLIDCYTTAVCTHQQGVLPLELHLSPNSNASALGNRLWKALEEETSSVYTYNNSQAARCASVNFYHEFFGGFDAKEIPFRDKNRAASKLLVYSAHDTTLLSFLASTPSIFNKSWPPYASMITFEVYRGNNSHSYFRVIHDGEDLTPKFVGCNITAVGAPCKISALVEALQWVHPHELLPFSIPSPASCHGILSYDNALFLFFGLFLGILFSAIVAALWRCYSLSKREMGYNVL